MVTVRVGRVVMMPAGSGLSQSLQRHLSGRTGHLAAQRLPELEVLEMALREDARDSAEAVLAMAERQVAAIVVLGGDGTHRVVARHCGDIPLCALSTGTNTPSRSCARPPWPGWRPAWWQPAGWAATSWCGGPSSSRSPSTAAPGTAPWSTWPSPPSAGSGRAPCGGSGRSRRRW
jgi:hypothetical protein